MTWRAVIVDVAGLLCFTLLGWHHIIAGDAVAAALTAIIVGRMTPPGEPPGASTQRAALGGVATVALFLATPFRLLLARRHA